MVTINPRAGQPAEPSLLVDVPKLISAYYTGRPDPSSPAERVAFGTSGHRGSSFDNSFNEGHVLAITQAICQYRAANGIDGPLFIGADTHALSTPALASAVEVMAANGVEVMLSAEDEYPRDSHTQPRPHRRPRRRHRHHPVAQSAGRWRLQVQPAARRARRTRHHLRDRGHGQRAARAGSPRRQASPSCGGAARTDHPPP